MSLGDRSQECRRTLGKKLGRLVCSPYVARHTPSPLPRAQRPTRALVVHTAQPIGGMTGRSGRSMRFVCAIGPAPGVAFRRTLRHLQQQDKGDVMRRGLFALPIPVFVLLAYNAVVLLGGDPAVKL